MRVVLEAPEGFQVAIEVNIYRPDGFTADPEALSDVLTYHAAEKLRTAMYDFVDDQVAARALDGAA